MKKMLPILVITVASLCVFMAGPLSAQPPAGKVYDVWVSQSFAAPPHQPFHDCAIFTSNTMALATCAGPPGPFAPIPLGGGLNIWIGIVPCDSVAGPLNLVWFGTTLPPGGGASGDDPLGASGIGATEGTNFGMGGMEAPNCVPFQFDGNPYAAQ